MKRGSIEAAVARLEKELAAIEPTDASLWAVVQASRPAVMAKRAEGASWAQLAAALRSAGFPNASESNVRLAAQAREPSKKVAKARRRQMKSTSGAGPSGSAAPAAAQPAAPTDPVAGPRLLRDRYK